MNLDLSEEQKLVQDTLAKVFREHSTGARIRAAEPLGFDTRLWQLVCELGLPRLRVQERHQGGGNSLMHAVIVAEEAGRYLASVPLAEAMVANGLLSRLSDHGKNDGGGAAWLQRCAAGELLATMALHDMAWAPVQIVPAGAVADTVLCLDRADVVALSGFERSPAPNLGSLPVQRFDLRAAPVRTVLATGAQAKTEFLRALEEWRLLIAAMCAAAARQALDNAADYARERIAFGKPIGAYQGLAHPLAEAVAEVDGARLLVWRAVDAIARAQPDAQAIVPMALWWAGQSGRNATLKAMRVFGGYGMTMEYDAQLYYRRVHAWSLQGGDPDQLLQVAGDRLWHNSDPLPLPEAGDVAIDFGFGQDGDAAAAAVRQFCARHHGDAMERFQYESLDGHCPELWREMAQTGFLYPDLPREHGGGGHGPVVSLAIADTIGDFGWYMTPVGVSEITARMVLHSGTDAARREILPRITRGEAFCSLGYTEPSGGSDVFAARTSAVPDGDDWLINGQKIFTSQGHIADYCLMLVRTGPDKYAGLTLFVVPLDQPGYRVTEVKTIGDDRTNITFYDNLRVPDKYRLGEVHGGVKVMAAALTMEQSGGDFYTAEMKHVLKHGLAWAQAAEDGEDAPITDPAVRRGLAEVKTRLLVLDSLSRRCVWAASIGAAHKSYGPMCKLFGSESWVSCTALLMRLAAPRSLLRAFSALGEIEKRSRRAIPGTIYAGTSEIQRSLIAESALRLPRTRG